MNQEQVDAFLAGRVRREWLIAIEKRVVIWSHGWMILAIAAFIAKWYVEQVSWATVAFVCFGQVVFTLLIMLCNFNKWRLTAKLSRLDKEMSRG